mgnify:CR=1 FL=1
MRKRKKITPPIVKTNGQNGKVFSQDQLRAALQDVENLLGGVRVPFMLLNETAKSLIDNGSSGPLTGSCITVGIQKKYITSEALSILATMLLQKGIAPSIDGFTYMVDEVSVVIKVIKRRYPFFQYPNFVYYHASEYLIPNPFHNYWKARFIIR